ncbi:MULTISPECIES: ABC transporter ATP-binding protein [Aestuariimicrobium]|uniref:ABC transporter ATP-binding protein n=1 Tax=Aestuariimicrobium TaxID=396388 RepID=UPI0003B6B951|nr:MULTISPECIES: ABC transporter ATP-binding protein [Aestuariimicrobium]CAI9399330.1 Vitamin B12 import ATP-binding protein BtuD [Aestuariimicrobium sp. T2.26MG-19.2B]
MTATLPANPPGLPGSGPSPSGGPIVSARRLTRHFQGRSRGGGRTTIRAVEEVDFDIEPGTIVALVGESGSGKTTLARMLALLHPPTSGDLVVAGKELPRRQRDKVRYYGNVQMIYQDPFASLNTLKPLRHILGRALRIHGRAKGRRNERELVAELLAKVNLTPPEQFVDAYPTSLSGGQRQRVAIARALAVRPRLLLADEPTSMLDASIRLDILNLLRDLRDSERVAILYITHDIASARYISDRIMVMYGGRIVEQGPTDDVVQNPRHPYTRLLVASAPDPAHHKGSGLNRRVQVVGDAEPVDVSQEVTGCRFAPRCPFVMDRCREQRPPLLQVGDQAAACWLLEDEQ